MALSPHRLIPLGVKKVTWSGIALKGGQSRQSEEQSMPENVTPLLFH